MMEDDQLALLEGVVSQLMGHVRKQVLEDGPVVELTSAEQMQKEIDFSIPDSTPRTNEDVLQACAQILKKSVNTSHPNFHNQLFACTRPAALAGEFITAVTNASMYTYEVAPVFTIMERVVLTKMYEKLGWVPEHCDGIFNPGGSMSNFYGMNLARFWKCEKLDYDVKRDGLCGGPRLVAYYSDHAHYSALKGAAFLGIGTANLIKVKVNAKGEMLVSDLKTKIQKSIEDGKTPFFIQATAGTTVLGAYDPLNEICDVAEKHQMWVHVDGCWGGSAVLSKKYRDLMAGVDRCDSVAWNPHKMMGIPLQCAAFLTRHHGYLHKAHSSQAKYLFQKDKLNAELDTGDKSVQCGRKVDVLKLWMAWVTTGDEGYEKHMDELWEAQQHLCHRVDTTDGFELVAEPSCTNVCFWYAPPSLRKGGAPAKGSDKYNQIVHSTAVEIKRRMQEEGTMMVGFQSIPLHDVESPPNFFRMVIMGHLTSKATMDFVVDEIARLGADL